MGADREEATSGLLALCVGAGVVAIRWPPCPDAGGDGLVDPGRGAARVDGRRRAAGSRPRSAPSWSAAGSSCSAACGARWAGAIARSRPRSPARCSPASCSRSASARSRAVVEIPWLAVPVVVVWAGADARRRGAWAAPGAIVAAIIAVAIDGPGDLSGVSVLPSLQLVSPVFEPAASSGIALPLFIVTMASQNIAGMGVLASFGYRPPFAPILRPTGVATLIAAPFGGHAVNLAAISAALAAGPDAHPDRAALDRGGRRRRRSHRARARAPGSRPPSSRRRRPRSSTRSRAWPSSAPSAGHWRPRSPTRSAATAAVVTFVVSASGVALRRSARRSGAVAGIAFLALGRLRGSPRSRDRRGAGGRRRGSPPRPPRRPRTAGTPAGCRGPRPARRGAPR